MIKDDRIIVMCMACENGDHYYCGMQTWCACDDPQDGDASPQEWEAYGRRMDGQSHCPPCRLDCDHPCESYLEHAQEHGDNDE
jgi:hypothetical protein